MGKSLPYENRLSLIIGGMIVDGKGACYTSILLARIALKKFLSLKICMYRWGNGIKISMRLHLIYFFNIVIKK